MQLVAQHKNLELLERSERSRSATSSSRRRSTQYTSETRKTDGAVPVDFATLRCQGSWRRAMHQRRRTGGLASAEVPDHTDRILGTHRTPAAGLTRMKR